LNHFIRSAACFVCLGSPLFAGVSLAQQASSGASASKATTPWELQNSTTKAALRGIHAVGGGVAWASGTSGTVLRTEDGGYMWQSCAMPPGAEKLDFRGIWAWDANTAVVMSSGPGDLSRLYKTTDGCSSWKLLYTNPDKDGFWDAVQFWDKDHGLILGDPVEEWRFKSPEYKGDWWRGKHFVLLQTNDGGTTWKWKWNGRGEIPTSGPENAGAFAASNSALTIHFPWAWFGIGKIPQVYVGHHLLMDFVEAGKTEPESDGIAWLHSTNVPVASGNDSAGVFSLAFRDESLIPYDKKIVKDDKNWLIQNHGVAVGGDYKKPNESNGTAAYTTDGGKSWTAADKPPHGYRSSVAWDGADKAWIAVGTNGSDVSYDDGKTWQPLDNGNWNALSIPWVVGPEGRIAKLVSLKPAVTSAK
jgi:photosystem II stability/assembly factor-like uncharacterized protein